MALPKTQDVIGYLNRDIFLMRLQAAKIEHDCKKDPITCSGCKEMQQLSDEIINYTKVVKTLIFKAHTVETEMRKD